MTSSAIIKHSEDVCFILECLTTKGKSCGFPFTYYGVRYTECTSVNNSGIPWCGISWGNCAESCTSDTNKAGDI